MIWISFKKWNNKAGKFFTYNRIYWKGQWTAFVKVSLRYTYKRLYEKINEHERMIEDLRTKIKNNKSIQDIMLNQMADFDKKLNCLTGQDKNYPTKKPKVKRSYRKKERKLKNEDN